jgi:hypothetical protein
MLYKLVVSVREKKRKFLFWIIKLHKSAKKISLCPPTYIASLVTKAASDLIDIYEKVAWNDHDVLSIQAAMNQAQSISSAQILVWRKCDDILVTLNNDFSSCFLFTLELTFITTIHQSKNIVFTIVLKASLKYWLR